MFLETSAAFPTNNVLSPFSDDILGRFWLPGGVSVPIPVSGVRAVLLQCDSDIRAHLTDGIGMEGIDCREAVGQASPTRTIYSSSAHPVGLSLGTGGVSGAFWTTNLDGASWQRLMSVGTIGSTQESYEFTLREDAGVVYACVTMMGAGSVQVLDSTNAAHRIALAAGRDWDADFNSVTNWIYSLKRNGANTLLQVWRNGVKVGNLTINDTNSAVACNPTAGLSVGHRSASNGNFYGGFYMGKIFPGIDLNDFEAQEIAKWGPMINPPNVRAPAVTAHAAKRASWASHTVAEFYASDMSTSIGAFNNPNSDPITTFLQWPGGPPATIQSPAILARGERVIATGGKSYLQLWTPPEVGAWVNILKV